MDVNTITSRINPANLAGTPKPAAKPAPERAVEQPKQKDPPAAPPSDLKFTLRSVDTEAKFAVHEATNSVMVTIFDRSTGEVIREIPSRRYLDLVAALSGKGTMLDESR